MIERHYEDEVLISLLESNRAASDHHLPACEPCSSRIESFRMIADALADQDVWDDREIRTESGPAATIANLRAFADRMSDEDTLAEAFLQELLAGSRHEWMPRLHEHPEWRTAGVVRKLVDRSYTTVMAMPPDAVEMTSVATTIATELDPADHPSDTIPRLRGSAWRAKAYALYYVGLFSEADAAVATAEAHFNDCAINEYELARVGIVKSLVLRPFERFSEATDAAMASAATFERYGDVEKTVSARLAEVHMLFSRNQYAKAEQILLDLEERISASVHAGTHARVLANLGEATRKLGKFEASIQYYDCASALMDSLGARTETVRIRWSVAIMLAQVGKVSEACGRLRDLTREMEYLGMTSEAAVASLDVVELLLAQNHYEEVSEICRATMQTFELAGLPYTSRALTALAYIREAADQRRADQKLVKNVREYIRELPRQPNLLFAPPPA
jgi:tetratricopeptide (TPR) repeat protein